MLDQAAFIVESADSADEHALEQRGGRCLRGLLVVAYQGMDGDGAVMVSCFHSGMMQDP